MNRRKLEIFLISVLVAIGVLVLWPFVVITIHSGEAGVMFRRFSGTELDKVYPEGLYTIWPWNRMYVYNARVQTVSRTIEALTEGGLPIKLTVVIRYRPDYKTLTLLHTQVGPDYVDKVVLPETISELRRNIGNYDPVEVYTTKRGLLDRIVLGALEQNERRFVTIDDVMIRSVELPEPIRKSIEEKLVYEQKQLAYKFRLRLEEKEADRKRIESRGIRDYNKTVQESLTKDIIRWQGVNATRELATSPNAKTVIIGSGPDGLPIILGNADAPPPPPLDAVRDIETAPAKTETK
ncbi:prohibitin family protein [Nisaea nitritireducens]|uniref:prohibitin family protein n=1 Tax=Nisaea nitritireducens TaxID=568392 RepID=UPI0018661CB9|nr:prohibitin family protein [Nisaea nitritireducens]